MAAILQFRYCHGCGIKEDKCDILVALPAHVYVCDDCIATMSAIVAKAAPEKARIRFVDYMVEMLKEPIEIVTKWKEIRARDAALTESKVGE